MSKVNMIVQHHHVVGAFMACLTRSAPDDRPSDVKEFMEALADFANKYEPSLRAGKQIVPSLGDLKNSKLSQSENTLVRAQFQNQQGTETSTADAVGSWSVFPYLTIENVRYDAALSLLNHAPEHVVLRLPEEDILEIAENEAQIFMQGDDADKFPLPHYYYNYHYGKSLNSLEYLMSRLGDYTTNTCR